MHYRGLVFLISEIQKMYYMYASSLARLCPQNLLLKISVYPFQGFFSRGGLHHDGMAFSMSEIAIRYMLAPPSVVIVPLCPHDLHL